MKIIIDLEDTEIIRDKTKEMLKAYIKYSLKMFKINKIEFEDETKIRT